MKSDKCTDDAMCPRVEFFCGERYSFPLTFSSIMSHSSLKNKIVALNAPILGHVIILYFIFLSGGECHAVPDCSDTTDDGCLCSLNVKCNQ